MLPGCQFTFDGAFDLLDWDDDGTLDYFFMNAGMIGAVAYLNEGSATHPVFKHRAGYPLNITETEPQTVEHNQVQCLCDLNHDGLRDAQDVSVETHLGIWRQAETQSPFVRLESVVWRNNREVRASLPGFSRYAIAY
jgi:hypothetical protein